LIYSVIVSVGLLWLISWWRTDSSGSIGLSKLFWFAAAGGVAGVVVGGSDHVVRWLVRRRNKALAALADAAEVRVGDQPQDLLEKLLNKYSAERKPRAVVTQDQKVYTGSLMEKTEDTVAIIGWYHVVKDNIQAANRAEIINALDQAKSSIEILNIAHNYKLTIEPRNPVRLRMKGVDSEAGEAETLVGPGIVAEQHFDTDEDEVIVVE